METQGEQSRKPAKLNDISQYVLIHFAYVLSQTSNSHFRLKSGHRNKREYYVHWMAEHVICCPGAFLRHDFPESFLLIFRQNKYINLRRS